VGSEYLDEALVLGPVLLEPLELVAAGTECAARRVTERRDRLAAFLARIDEVLGQCPDDAVATRVNLADVLAMLAGGLDDAAGAGIDHGADAARLCVKGVSRHFGLPSASAGKNSAGADTPSCV
jgi:hypothetical protein